MSKYDYLNSLSYGCVFFDDTTRHEEGWACEAGGEPFRITGTKDLRSDVIWMTNLEHSLMFHHGISDNARLRKKDFLRIPVEKMAELVGLDEDPFERVLHLSGILKNVMNLFNVFFDTDYQPKYSLGKGIREFLSNDPVLPSRVKKALEDATIYWVSCERNFEAKIEDEDEGSAFFSFRVPALQHAKEILSLPYPSLRGKWQRINKKKIPDVKSEEFREWLISKPLLLKVVISSLDDRFYRLLNYGAGVLGNPRSNRQWLTNVELLAYLDLAEIQVYEALCCDKAMNLDYFVNILDEFSPICELSISCSIFFENIWTGLSLSHPPNSKDLKKESYNPLTPFLRAFDRIICFRKAIKLSEYFNVLGYGVGKIAVNNNFNRMSLENMLDICRDYNLLPPTGVILPKGKIKIENNEDYLEILRCLYLLGKTNTLLDSDKKIVADIISEKIRMGLANQKIDEEGI